MNIQFIEAGMIGGQELLLILLAVLILFGAKKIPEFARGLGQGIKEFRRASREIQEEIERAAQEHPSSYPSYHHSPDNSQHTKGSEINNYSTPGQEKNSP